MSITRSFHSLIENIILTLSLVQIFFCSFLFAFNDNKKKRFDDKNWECFISLSPNGFNSYKDYRKFKKTTNYCEAQIKSKKSFETSTFKARCVNRKRIKRFINYAFKFPCNLIFCTNNNNRRRRNGLQFGNIRVIFYKVVIPMKLEIIKRLGYRINWIIIIFVKGWQRAPSDIVIDYDRQRKTWAKYHAYNIIYTFSTMNNKRRHSN